MDDAANEGSKAQQDDKADNTGQARQNINAAMQAATGGIAGSCARRFTGELLAAGSQLSAVCDGVVVELRQLAPAQPCSCSHLELLVRLLCTPVKHSRRRRQLGHVQGEHSRKVQQQQQQQSEL